jgi:antitoxin component YwqK of YwqJK toxin-antitoxin module
MKKLLAAMFVALLMVGCGEYPTPFGPADLDDKETLEKIIAEAIDGNTLQERGNEGEKLVYEPNQQKPYTGWVKGMHDNGQIKILAQIKDGKRHGLGTGWYENGQKLLARNYKDGKPDGLGTFWYSNGQKEIELNFKDGKLMSAEVWKPNGEKCPVTKIDKDGNGVMVAYNEDGTESSRSTYKDSKVVVMVAYNEDGTESSRLTFKDGKVVEDDVDLNRWLEESDLSVEELAPPTAPPPNLPSP